MRRSAISDAPASSANSAPPELARRKLNKKSTLKIGRTIAEKRERLETASERATAHKAAERQKRFRIASITLGFLGAGTILVLLFFAFTSDNGPDPYRVTIATPFSPTIEVVDEASSAGGALSSRMSEYIGMLESDLRSLGYIPVKAVIPASSIREVDIYLEGYSGFIKTLIDRGSGVTAEDTDRMLRYLANIGQTDFTYIDVRLEGKAYWK